VRFSRAFSLNLALCFLPAGVALAQNNTNVTLPSSGGQTCVQVQAGGQTSSAYDCLNRQLQQQTQATQHAMPQAPFAAGSAPNQTGTFNKQGVSEQYGQNFGKSAVPYRPPAPIFNNGLRP
jgi:hypothetical protein